MDMDEKFAWMLSGLFV